MPSADRQQVTMEMLQWLRTQTELSTLYDVVAKDPSNRSMMIGTGAQMNLMATSATVMTDHHSGNVVHMS
jgi:hypothetical protein